MAKLEDLVDQVSDVYLQAELRLALAELKRRQHFGLVYEEHIPETSELYGYPLRVGNTVRRRADTSEMLRVVELEGRTATVESRDGERSIVDVRDIFTIANFGEPIYPALTSLGYLQRGDERRPFHSVIDAENYHALQLLTYTHAGAIDCIFIDPPYNTGGTPDWKYNNKFVDGKDKWRHSKWLSMMEKRLRLARRLLKADGVLVVTIDEHEIFHLGMLLERIFPEYLLYTITVVINASGNTGTHNFGVIDEHALYCVPSLKDDVIPQEPVEDAGSKTEEYWDHARRRGGGSSYRFQRLRQFYPIFIDERSKTVVSTGQFIPLESEPDFEPVNGLRPIWPIDSKGNERVWCYTSSTMSSQIAVGNVSLGKYNSKTDTWTLRVKRKRTKTRRPRTVLVDSAHHAGTHGTDLVNRLLGQPNLFPFPKSVFEVRDLLANVVRDRPDAVILDFFAGSGTTLHATCMLNAQDEGSRACILVTNNEVSLTQQRVLNGQGKFRGDPEYDRNGIFEIATRPRVEAVITGRTPGGDEVEGDLDGRPISQGFAENVEFLRLTYLDPDDVDLGQQFNAILPLLWLAAGGVGRPEMPKPADSFTMPKSSNYGVLFRESRFSALLSALESRPDVRHVWLVTDSPEAFAEMHGALPAGVKASMLYRDYLRNFKINTGRIL